jgi:hypothetical protein
VVEGKGYLGGRRTDGDEGPGRCRRGRWTKSGESTEQGGGGGRRERKVGRRMDKSRDGRSDSSDD